MHISLSSLLDELLGPRSLPVWAAPQNQRLQIDPLRVEVEDTRKWKRSHESKNAVAQASFTDETITDFQ